MSNVGIDHVTKRYGAEDPPAVDDVSLSIGSGEFFTLLGPSGCGKSTTLRMVAGFVTPTEGRIRIGDEDVTDRPPNSRPCSMVFQSYALFPHLDVRGNVGFGLKVRGVDRQERERRIGEVLELVQLEHLIDRRLDQLSGGQQQRVALARALVVEPSLLLLDEPLSNLDAKLREDTRVELRRIQRHAGTTALYVTHDQAEAMAMSDRVAVLEDGRVHQVGPPEEIYAKPATAFVASFIGRMNLLETPIKQRRGDRLTVEMPGGAALDLDRSQAASHEALEGDTVMLALRPEALTLTDADDPNVLTARVRHTEFTGVHREYRLDAHGVGLWVLAQGSNPGPAPNEVVGVRVTAESAWVVQR